VLLYRKRVRWLELWDEGADMIAAFESKYTPGDAEWAAFSAQELRRRFAYFLRQIQLNHTDMPDVELRPDDTGRYRAVMSSVDTLEAFYFHWFEDDNNNLVDKAKTDIERRRRITAGRQLREYIDDQARDSFSEA